MTDLHRQFLEFTERALTEKKAAPATHAPDLHEILACLAEGGDVYGLMSRVPDDQIKDVLTWVMNVDMPDL